MKYAWKNILLGPEQTIREALEIINAEALRTALVVDDYMHLVGVVTDGDIRRGLLNNLTISEPVSSVMNAKPITADSTMNNRELLKLMRDKSILSVPIVHQGVVIGLQTLQQVLDKPKLDNPVFLMAGGFGKRLRPLTDRCPKPMLKVGDKPILETVLINFIEAGFHQFYISTHYLADQIKDYFGNGEKWGVTIHYVHEQEPLGTGGALGLLPPDLPQLPLIMMNSDILTKVDFQRLLAFHNDSDALATMCVREYEYQIPYGVVQGEAGFIKDMVEKPTQHFFVNAGIYVIEPSMTQMVKSEQMIDMPTLLEQCINDSYQVQMFPIHEYWLDIGKHDDFNKAQVDIAGLV